MQVEMKITGSLEDMGLVLRTLSTMTRTIQTVGAAEPAEEPPFDTAPATEAPAAAAPAKRTRVHRNPPAAAEPAAAPAVAGPSVAVEGSTAVVEVQPQDAAALLGVGGTPAAAPAAPVPPPPPPAPPAPPAAAPAPVPAVTQAPPAAPVDPNQKSPGGLDWTSVRKIMTDFHAKGGREALESLLMEYGYSRMIDVRVEDWDRMAAEVAARTPA